MEEGVIAGGAGSAVSECLARLNLQTPILHLGLPDHIIEHGESSQQLAELGLDAKGIVAAVRT